MARTRYKLTINNNYVQPLKLGINSNLVITPNVNYNSVLFSSRHERLPKILSTKVFLWAKFSSDNFDGINCLSKLLKNEKEISAENCTISVFSIENNNTWQETLLNTKVINLQQNVFKIDFSQNELGINTELLGETTFKLECSITRLGKTFKKVIYLNHLGVYESVFKLQQDVDFLFVTKKDE